MYVVRRGPTLIGVVSALLVTLLVLFLVIGWWRNWYGVSGSDDPQQVNLGVQINKDEVARDFDQLRDETERVTESAQVAAELQTVDGMITDVSQDRVVIREGDSQHTFTIDEATKFFVGSADARLQEISVGDPARVTFQETDGHKRAARITIERNDAT